MKLLTRTTGYYLPVSLVLFVLGGLIFYQMLRNIFEKELDSALIDEKLLIEETINFSDSVPDFRLVFGHMIDVTILNSPRPKQEYIRDTLMYDSDAGSFVGFRHLLAENTSMRHKGYIINIYRTVDERNLLITRIILAFTLLFLVLLVMLVIVNYFTSRKVWIPFHRTISALSHYDINRDKPLKFSATDIVEFNQLNRALEVMSEKIHRDYLNLREFNANAAHELMTPIAVIKSKLELLIQRKDVDEQQMQLTGAVFEALSRMSKLIQSLLLLSKIENNQYKETGQISIERVLDRTIEHFGELIDHRGLTVTRDYHDTPVLVMNPALAEILISNLLSNAIRHNNPNGRISIVLERHRLVITNTGQPLADDPGTLFQRFRKSGNNPESIGLGLSIVQKITGLYRMKAGYIYNEGLHTIEISF